MKALIFWAFVAGILNGILLRLRDFIMGEGASC